MKFEPVNKKRVKKQAMEYPLGVVVKSNTSGAVYMVIRDSDDDFCYLCLAMGDIGSGIKAGTIYGGQMDCNSIDCKLVENEA